MSTIDSFNTTSVANSIANTSKANETHKATNKYGNVIGKPELSDSAAEYYNSLKEKYHNLEFVLVDNDSVDTAEQQASRFMGSGKTVVLLDANKIEAMASDQSVRSKYETLIENGAKQIEEMGNSLASTGANVKGYGIRINEDGTSTLFAVVDKSIASQRERIEKLQEKHKAEKAEKHEKTNKPSNITKDTNNKVDAIDIINASSIEELIDKLAEYMQNNRLNEVKTEEETYVGQSIDFKL